MMRDMVTRQPLTPAVDPHRRRRPGGRSANVRAAVQRATIELLEQVGYHALQLTDVAERAGVNKSTVYRRWPDKARLVADVMADFADEQVPVPDTGTLHDDLVELITGMAAILDQPATRATLQANVPFAGTDGELDVARQRFWARQFADSAVIVQRAIARAEVDPSTDPRLVLDMVSGPVYFRRLVTNEPVTSDYVARLACAVVATCTRGGMSVD